MQTESASHLLLDVVCQQTASIHACMPDMMSAEPKGSAGNRILYRLR